MMTDSNLGFLVAPGTVSVVFAAVRLKLFTILSRNNSFSADMNFNFIKFSDDLEFIVINQPDSVG